MLDTTSVDIQPDNLRAQCSAAESRLAALRRQVVDSEQRLEGLKTQLQRTEAITDRHRHSPQHGSDESPVSLYNAHDKAENREDKAGRHSVANHSRTIAHFPFTPEEYKRYGRQLIIPEIAARGQAALKHARVLIIGVGGLGCPAAAYLAGAGVGTIGLVDGDTVEVSNLHRQIAHASDRVGMSKVASAYTYLRSLNPLVNYEQHQEHLTPAQAVPLFERYDVVLDCTDHPTSRYLISDACVLTGKPLVSASALKTEGQLIVLNNPAKASGDRAGGPCYRCIFPKPPPAETVVSCGEGGILGPVVGAMGVLQALETIKILTKSPSTVPREQSPRTSMLLFSAYSDVQFRTMKMRGRRADCAACSDQHTITRESLTSGTLDYAVFCGVRHTADALHATHHRSAAMLAKDGFTSSSRIIDVRDKTQFGLCSLEGSINIPWTGDARSWQKAAEDINMESSDQVYLICRHGNDSQAAAMALMDARPEVAHRVVDITGGLQAWKQQVDPDWPDY